MGQEGPSIIHQKSKKRNKLNQECYCQKVVYFSQEESSNHHRNETRLTTELRMLFSASSWGIQYHKNKTRETTESRMKLSECSLFHGSRRGIHYSS